MDRRNGGDPLAPPRPPKLLPKIHRPRAPEPEMMNNSRSTAAAASATTVVGSVNQTATAKASLTSSSTEVTGKATEVINTPQCTNQTDLSGNNNLNQAQQQQHQISINQTLSTISTTLATTTNTAAPASIAINPISSLSSSSSISCAPLSTATPPISSGSGLVVVGNNIRYNRVSCNNNHIGNIDVITQQPGGGLADDYQIHHLTFLPQRPGNLSRNGSQISTTSSSTSTTSVGSSVASTNALTVANSFTRRRPPPATPAAAVPLLTISGNHANNNNNNNNNSFLNHFHNPELVQASTVTLAQPRPESERLGNEYVDTPLRTAQQLQNATRIQHPAGEHDNGQTTTHHLLLLPQRELRQLQQTQNHQLHQVHQHHNTQRVGSAAGSANTTTLGGGVDGTDGILHSQHHHHHHQLHHQVSKGTPPMPVTGKLSSPTDPRGFASSGLIQPITKQPALSNNVNSCKFAKELPALDELLDIHNIATGIPTSQGMISAVNGASPLTTPIVIGSSDAPSSLNPITCPRCDRCRCEQCQSPRPLPQTWVCNKTCLCSAESIIDYASCLCCAKALFYHCARDNDLDCDDGSGTPCVDNPCSCGPYKRTQRWGWLGALSIVLPCLWCYWPMRACVSACEKCYGRFARRGCRCQQIGSTSSMFPITSVGSNGSNIMALSNGNGMPANTGGNTEKSAATDMGGHHYPHQHQHHHHHNECNSAASRILRKGDLTPEKRLLDSSPEY